MAFRPCLSAGLAFSCDNKLNQYRNFHAGTVFLNLFQNKLELKKEDLPSIFVTPCYTDGFRRILNNGLDKKVDFLEDLIKRGLG